MCDIIGSWSLAGFLLFGFVFGALTVGLPAGILFDRDRKKVACVVALLLGAEISVFTCLGWLAGASSHCTDLRPSDPRLNATSTKDAQIPSCNCSPVISLTPTLSLAGDVSTAVPTGNSAN